MNKNNIKKFINKELIKTNKRYENMSYKKNFFDQGIDSLDFYTLMFKIEEKFKIKIPAKVYNKLNSSFKIEQYIKKIL